MSPGLVLVVLSALPAPAVGGQAAEPAPSTLPAAPRVVLQVAAGTGATLLAGLGTAALLEDAVPGEVRMVVVPAVALTAGALTTWGVGRRAGAHGQLGPTLLGTAVGAGVGLGVFVLAVKLLDLPLDDPGLVALMLGAVTLPAVGGTVAFALSADVAPVAGGAQLRLGLAF